MSHAATRWAMKQRGLKPAAKIVLFYLCDHHSEEHGCFPSQETLADECEMSRSTLNLQLIKLEEMGLLRRHSSVDDRTKRQRPTRYILAFEDESRVLKSDNAVSENRTRAVSEKQTEPCPISDESRVLKSDTNPVIANPVSEAAAAREDEPTFREKLIEAAGYPRSGINPKTCVPSSIGSPADMVTVEKWRSELGVTDSEILEVIKAGVQRKGSPPGSLRFFSGHMTDFAAAKAQGLPANSPAFSQQTEKDKHKSYLRKLGA